MREIRTIGIIGAGKLGITLARIARHYGFDVNIAGSGGTEKIALTVEVLAPGAKALTTADLVTHSDVTILALPLGKFRTLPEDVFEGKLVIDAMNYWWEVDGSRDDIIPSGQSSSVAVQEFLSNAHIVKAFNHMGYHDLFDEHKAAGAPGRKAIAIASDDKESVGSVVKLVDRLGFDAIVIGNLAAGHRLEPGTNMFGANVNADGIRQLIDAQSSH